MRERASVEKEQKVGFSRNQLLTVEDLENFKAELFDEIKKLLKAVGTGVSKKWLKSYEVKKLLSISSGTLQTMRDNKSLPFTRIGGVIYYDYEEIEKILKGTGNANSSRSGNTMPFINNRKSRMG